MLPVATQKTTHAAPRRKATKAEPAEVPAGDDEVKVDEEEEETEKADDDEDDVELGDEEELEDDLDD